MDHLRRPLGLTTRLVDVASATSLMKRSVQRVNNDAPLLLLTLLTLRYFRHFDLRLVAIRFLRIVQSLPTITPMLYLDLSQLFDQFLDNLPIIDVLLQISDHNAFLGQLVVQPVQQQLTDLLHLWVVPRFDSQSAEALA